MANLWDALWQPVNCVANLGTEAVGHTTTWAVGVANSAAQFVQCVVTNMQGIM